MGEDQIGHHEPEPGQLEHGVRRRDAPRGVEGREGEPQLLDLLGDRRRRPGAARPRSARLVPEGQRAPLGAPAPLGLELEAVAGLEHREHQRELEPAYLVTASNRL